MQDRYEMNDRHDVEILHQTAEPGDPTLDIPPTRIADRGLVRRPPPLEPSDVVHPGSKPTEGDEDKVA